MIDFLGAVPSLLVASDFDGTLSELVDDILAALPIPRAVDALKRLAGTPGTHVAIISGRRRSDLVERFDDRRFILIGEHGADAGGGMLGRVPGTHRDQGPDLRAEPARCPGHWWSRRTTLWRSTTGRLRTRTPRWRR